MALDFDNLVFDRPLRVRMQDKTNGDLFFMVEELKEATLTNGSEQVFLTGAAGTRIAALDRNKTTTLTFQNGLISMAMMAAQTGTKDGVEVASATNKIVTPAFETIKVGANSGEVNNTITLAHTPVEGSIKFIYVLRKDKSLGQKFALNDASGASAETFSIAGNVITLPTNAGITADTRIAVDYKYEAESALKVVSRADEFAKKGVVILEVLLRDICDNNKKYYANLVIPNGAMSGQFDISMSGEGVVHAATVEAMPDICSEDKELFSWIVPEAA